MRPDRFGWGVRSGPTRGWCAATRKPTLTTEPDSLCEVAHTARGKVTIISSDRGLPAVGDVPGRSAGLAVLLMMVQVHRPT
jgi:hypothetical protein